jgi:hypothetical protein
MREDEEHCKEVFNTFLKQYYRDVDIIWTPGDMNKPPDYFLSLHHDKYVVEITSVIEKTTLDNKIVDHIAIDKSIKKFIEGIRKDAIEKGFLKGAYIVRYKPITDFGKYKQAISTRIRDYLQRTQHCFFAAEDEIFSKGHNSWYIYKLQSDRTYLSVTSGDAKWKGEAEDELCNLINIALQKKVNKLKNISLPKILLLNDRFVWINAGEWPKYISKLNYMDYFHTIFLISDKSTNIILHSVTRSWLDIPA